MRAQTSRQWIIGNFLVQVGTVTTVLIPAVAGKILRITSCWFTATITAAQTATLEATGGTDLFSTPVSPAIGVPYGFGPLFAGIALPIGEGLQVNLSAAGLAGNIVYEGYYDLQRIFMKIKDFDVKDVGLVNGKLSVTLDLTIGGETETEEFTASAVLTLPLSALNVLLAIIKDKL